MIFKKCSNCGSRALLEIKVPHEAEHTLHQAAHHMLTHSKHVTEIASRNPLLIPAAVITGGGALLINAFVKKEYECTKCYHRFKG